MAGDASLPSRGRVHALVVFAQFKGESRVPVPDFTNELFDLDLPGSFSHFHQAMSFGQLQVTGTVLSRRYVSERPAWAYLASRTSDRGEYGQFVDEILRQANAVVADVFLPRWAGTIRERVQWLGDIVVDGDLRIAPNGALCLYIATRVRFSGADRLRGGLDPSRCELRVEGELRVNPSALRRCLQRYKPNAYDVYDTTASEPVVLRTALAEGRWFGVIVEDGGRLQAPSGSLEIATPSTPPRSRRTLPAWRWIVPLPSWTLWRDG